MRMCEREFVALALVKSKYLVLFWHETKTKLSARQTETDCVPMFKLYERILGYVQAWYSRIRTARKQVLSYVDDVFPPLACMLSGIR